MADVEALGLRFVDSSREQTVLRLTLATMSLYGLRLEAARGLPGNVYQGLVAEAHGTCVTAQLERP